MHKTQNSFSWDLCTYTKISLCFFIIKKAFLKNTDRLLVIICPFLKIRYMLRNLFLSDILENVCSWNGDHKPCKVLYTSVSCSVSRSVDIWKLLPLDIGFTTSLVSIPLVASEHKVQNWSKLWDEIVVLAEKGTVSIENISLRRKEMKLVKME